MLERVDYSFRIKPTSLVSKKVDNGTLMFQITFHDSNGQCTSHHINPEDFEGLLGAMQEAIEHRG